MESNCGYGLGVGNGGGFGAAGYGGVVWLGGCREMAPSADESPHADARLELELSPVESPAAGESECEKVFHLFGVEVL